MSVTYEPPLTINDLDHLASNPSWPAPASSDQSVQPDRSNYDGPDVREKWESMGPVARSVRNVPVTTIGVLVGGGLSADQGSCDDFEQGLVLCSGLSMDGAMTIGNTILTPRSYAGLINRPELVKHEISHSTQSATLGNDVYVLV